MAANPLLFQVASIPASLAISGADVLRESVYDPATLGIEYASGLLQMICFWV